MRIIILGAGQVGGTLAYNLIHEDNDITLIDINIDRLRELHHRLDIKTVHGCASHPNILMEAGIEQADMLIAVTNSDEINMIACQIAYSLFRTPSKIARIRSAHYYNYPQLFCHQHVPVDVIISPEKLVTDHIVSLIDHPGAAQVLEFAEGKLFLLTIKAHATGSAIGKTPLQFEQTIGPIQAKIVTLFRQGAAVMVTLDTLIQPNDDVLVAATPQAIDSILIALGRYTHPNRRIIIAGGGHIGMKLAQALENKYRVKIIEYHAQQAHYLAQAIHKATILHGDAGDRELLINENIEFTDIFCAVTNDDEVNIMACLQAKKLGARQVLSLVNRNAYVELIADSNIDQAISPQQITIGSILTKLRRGNMIKICRLTQGEAEAIELVIHGDETSSRVIGQRLSDIPLPPSCTVAAVIRKEKTHIAQPDLILASGDHIIILVLKKRYVRQVESLFQVMLTFRG